jgi:predicted metal-dependent HD superfamily phosphohydrolase
LREAEDLVDLVASARAPLSGPLHLGVIPRAVDDDARLVVDIDLSILGQDELVYDQFERSVREEYKWVPWFLYRRKRTEILRGFLDRESIYATEPFRQRYETAARTNLERAIRALE